MNAGIIVLIVIGAILVLGVAPTLLISYVIYRELFVRKHPNRRERHCSFPDNEEYVGMYKEALEWGEKYDSCRRPVDIYNDGMHLFGEYYDFGSDTAVIIIPGRTEDCSYSCYFAEPYRKAGCNVLCIDNRSHGLSDGRRHNLGTTEYRDILKWSELLVSELHNRSVILHGICIGASVAMFAVTSDKCPEYIVAMVTEGMYTTFRDSFIEHLKEGKRPIFPFCTEVMGWIRLLSHADVVNDGPAMRIQDLKRPILMLHSREDRYSLPEQGQWLYDHCNAPKKLVWFDRGAHSRIRPNNTEKFDNAIIDFITEELHLGNTNK